MLQMKSVGFLLVFTIGFCLGESNIFNSNYVVHQAIRKALEREELVTNCQKHLWMAVQNLTHPWVPENVDELWALKS